MLRLFRCWANIVPRGHYICACSGYTRRVSGGYYWSFGISGGGGFLAGWIIIVLFDHLENNRGEVYSPPVSPLGRHEKGVTNIGYNQVGLPPCLVNTVFYF